jgi:cyclophilin family peptidyl-prolyl cis-trans isomerase
VKELNGEKAMSRTAYLVFATAVGCLFSPAFAQEKPVYLIKTSVGDIKVELFEKEAPISAANFDSYVKDGFYDGTIFHRVIDGFMIQGGGMTPDMREKANKKPPIKNEGGNGLQNKKYTLAMARTSVPDSATSQFFINTTDNGFLDRAQSRDGVGYAVFGQVIEGQDVVDKIGKVRTGSKGGHQDVPVEPIVIEKVTKVEGGQ